MNPVQIFYKYTAWKNAKQYTKKEKGKKGKSLQMWDDKPKTNSGTVDKSRGRV